MKKPGYNRRMTREEINDCPLIHYEGEIRVVRTRAAVLAAAAELTVEKVIGFDTEARPSHRKGQNNPPALLQLAGSKTVFLFQIKKIRFPNVIRKILENPEIIKAGVAIGDDIRELKRIGHFKEKSFVDLAVLARKTGIKNQGLRGMSAVLLGSRISKTAQKSDWYQTNLTQAQIRYAATDAWISREIYFKLKDLHP